jgi:hypothetical protein
MVSLKYSNNNLKKRLTYACIGSRKAAETKNIKGIMQECIIHLNAFNALNRTGGADACDQWGEEVAIESEIFIPFAKFRPDLMDNPPAHKKVIKTWLLPKEIKDKAMEMAEEVSPHLKFARYGARVMHGRNPFQILGKDLNDPDDFVLCYTKHGKIEGGTATAIKLALKYNIPVFNLGAVDGLINFKAFMKQYINNQ